MTLTEKLRFFVFAVYYMTVTFQLIAWKYQTKDIYFRFTPGGKILLILMHATIVITNVILFLIFISKDVNHALPVVKVTGYLCFISGICIFTWGLSYLGIRVFAPREEDKLVKEGPFRFVRHPMYLGGIIAASGLSLAFGSMLGLVYSLILGLVLGDIATYEERDLLNRFGKEYEYYMGRVPRLNPLLIFFKAK